MAIQVRVSEHVILSDSHVFAETATTVFRSPAQSIRSLLRLGNQVRHYRMINLTEWDAFDKSLDRLPSAYLEAII